MNRDNKVKEILENVWINGQTALRRYGKPTGIVNKALTKLNALYRPRIDEGKLARIFDILKKSAVQTKQFKAPVILYMHFEKIAKEIVKKI